MSTPKKNRLADTIRHPDPQTISRPVAETLRETGESPLTRRTTIYLSEQTWKKIKITAIEEETNVSQIIEKLLKGYLNSKEH